MPYKAPSPIDFDAKRRAIVQAVALGTGLPASQVMMAEGETMGSPRPKAPYVAFMTTAPSVKYGYDWQTPIIDNPAMPTGLHLFEGVRAMSVSFDSFGRTHEEAYGVMAAFQASLEYPPVASLLDAAGLAVWDIGSVADISALLATAYEGRAHMDVTFGMTASIAIDLGRIDSVPVSGEVASDGANSLTIPQDVILRTP